MTYLRVIPRDLFNEADLLKCWGRLVILLEDAAGRHEAEVRQTDNGPFDVQQDEGSGSILIANLELLIRGRRRSVFRPLNARSRWPLWVDWVDEDVRVFDDTAAEGALSAEFLRLIGLSLIGETV